MRRISYSGGSFLTTDGVADALLHFVAALGSSHRAEAVDIPIVRDDGQTDTVQLVIGPASELVSASENTTMPEPDSAEAEARLHRLTEALVGPKPVPSSQADATAHGYDFDVEL
ncbi:hypothetical protein [Subtercola vilae]|uniref:Uncharacterized protein n=1 Tax=Subtercola vilae TaxID=2056433 RepID=A0A4T2C8S1_9MICO|nr:hypothetical protein [Subtercola vilae]TIH40339.1 hypothetical protein D4765_01935 [Subtercola vilae]